MNTENPLPDSLEQSFDGIVSMEAKLYLTAFNRWLKTLPVTQQDEVRLARSEITSFRNRVVIEEIRSIREVLGSRSSEIEAGRKAVNAELQRLNDAADDLELVAALSSLAASVAAIA